MSNFWGAVQTQNQVFRRPFFIQSGAGEGNRTPDLRVTNALLYRLSYTGTVFVIIYINGMFGKFAFPDKVVAR